MRDGSWMENTPCSGLLPEYRYEVFFSNVDTNKYKRPEVAYAICEGCDFRDECVDEMVFGRSEDGIWGGITTKQGHKLYDLVDASDPREDFGEVANSVAWLLCDEKVKT